MSYLEYVNKLSELKQTIVGYGDALSALGNLFVLLGKFALTTIVVAALATIIAVVVDWFIEKLMNGISGLLMMRYYLTGLFENEEEPMW